MEMKIILSMIVKNEAKIILRCLTSVLPIIDAAVISDTGSDDDTKSKIHEFFISHSFLHYAVLDQGFINYGSNRTLAFQSAKEFVLTQNYDIQYITNILTDLLPLHAPFTGSILTVVLEFLQLQEWVLEKSFALILDADMVLMLPMRPLKPKWKQELHAADMFLVKQKQLPFTLWNPRLLRLSKPWICRGFAHEYWGISPETSCEIKQLTSCWIFDYNDGGNKKDKFNREIRLLLAQFNLEPKNPRLSYFLGNSYHGKGDLDEAIFWYKKRIKQKSNYPEEEWHAKYMIARIYYEKKMIYDALTSLLEAYNFRPNRIEPLALLIRIYRETKKYNTALLFCKIAQRIEATPHEMLFIEHDLYQHEILEEISYLAFFVNNKEMGLNACEKLRFNKNIPHSVQRYAVRSLHCYVEIWNFKDFGEISLSLRSGKLGHPTFAVISKKFLSVGSMQNYNICFETICCILIPIYTGLPQLRFLISFRTLSLDFVFYEGEISNTGGYVKEGKLLYHHDCLYYFFYAGVDTTTCYQSQITFETQGFVFQPPEAIETKVPVGKKFFPWYFSETTVCHLMDIDPPQYFSENQLLSGKKLPIHSEFCLLAGPCAWEGGWLLAIVDSKEFFRFLYYDSKFQKLEKMTYPFHFPALITNENIGASLQILDSYLVILFFNSKKSKISLHYVDLKNLNDLMKCFSVESLTNQWENFYF